MSVGEMVLVGIISSLLTYYVFNYGWDRGRRDTADRVIVQCHRGQSIIVFSLDKQWRLVPQQMERGNPYWQYDCEDCVGVYFHGDSDEEEARRET